MPTANIILIILAIIAVVCIGILAATHFAAAKRKKELPREIGVVSVVMTSRVPGREQYQMSIMRHGRPITTCVSMPCKRGSFRVGAKVRWRWRQWCAGVCRTKSRIFAEKLRRVRICGLRLNRIGVPASNVFLDQFGDGLLLPYPNLLAT